MNTGSNLRRGEFRERALDESAYFGPNYFSMGQLYSQSRQIHDIYALNPGSVIEIGIGNGFTSSYLRKGGIHVTTVDINRKLNPDICCPLDQVPARLQGEQFDLAVCCEVLEHIPFEQFEQNIRILRGLSAQLYLTLPCHFRSFGFGGLLRIPKMSKDIAVFLDFPSRTQLIPEHFWEVGHSHETRKAEIFRTLQKYYKDIKMARYTLNPYHVAFTAKA